MARIIATIKITLSGYPEKNKCVGFMGAGAEILALISPQLPAPPPARRPEPYGSESRACCSERDVPFALDCEWNDGMVASGS